MDRRAVAGGFFRWNFFCLVDGHFADRNLLTRCRQLALKKRRH